jgi:hypothetical protein
LVEICARIWGETHEEVRSLKRYLVLFTTTVFLVAGCATAYRPVIDPLSTTDSATLEKDLSECEEIARLHMDDASSTAVKSGAASTAKAAALGAVLGALAGAISGSPGTGAAIGAATGGATAVIRGAATASTSTQWQYENAYDTCMWDRGYELLNPYPAESPPSNPE